MKIHFLSSKLLGKEIYQKMQKFSNRSDTLYMGKMELRVGLRGIWFCLSLATRITLISNMTISWRAVTLLVVLGEEPTAPLQKRQQTILSFLWVVHDKKSVGLHFSEWQQQQKHHLRKIILVHLCFKGWG